LVYASAGACFAAASVVYYLGAAAWAGYFSAAAFVAADAGAGGFYSFLVAVAVAC